MIVKKEPVDEVHNRREHYISCSCATAGVRNFPPPGRLQTDEMLCQCFPQFLRLLTEIRLQTWRLALLQPRVHHLRLIDRASDESFTPLLTKTLSCSTVLVRIILATCQESRAEACVDCRNNCLSATALSTLMLIMTSSA